MVGVSLKEAFLGPGGLSDLGALPLVCGGAGEVTFQTQKLGICSFGDGHVFQPHPIAYCLYNTVYSAN